MTLPYGMWNLYYKIMKRKKTRAEIDKDIKFIPMPEWQNTYQYHRTNKRALYVDQNKKR